MVEFVAAVDLSGRPYPARVEDTLSRILRR